MKKSNFRESPIYFFMLWCIFFIAPILVGAFAGKKQKEQNDIYGEKLRRKEQDLYIQESLKTKLLEEQVKFYEKENKNNR